MQVGKNDAINDPRSINTRVFLLIKSGRFITSWTRINSGAKMLCSLQILQHVWKKDPSTLRCSYCNGNQYDRHYWACSVLASSPSGGVVISSQSRFTLRVPPKESMLRHIRKSPRLIKPLIFCDASTLLNTIYRSAAPGHSVCFMERLY